MSFGAGLFGSTAAAAAPSTDFPVAPQPDDSISALRWSPNADLLAASSWDGKVRIYQVQGNAANGVMLYDHGTSGAPGAQPAPVLDVCWTPDGSKVVSAGTDKRAILFDCASQQAMQIAQHDAPIKAVRSVSIGGQECLATASWDRTLRYWDPRSPRELAQVELKERAYAMDTDGRYIVVATADRHLASIDTRQGPDKVTWLTSSLKWQTRTVACFGPISNEAPRLGRAASPEASAGFVVGSIEGRVCVMYHDPAAQKEHGFSFRCHRKEFKTGPEREIEKRKATQAGELNTYGAFPVNVVAFNLNNTYATAGSDGNMSLWDNYSKSRLKTFDKQPGPISAAAYSRDATLLAYAVSYDWSGGHMGNTPDMPKAIMVHRTKPEEVQRKPKR